MSLRQFDNPQNIHWRVIKYRLFNADPQAIIDIHKIEIRDPVTFLVTGTRDQINVDTILTEQQVLNGLSTPATQAELNAIIREDGAREIAKAIPNWASWSPTQWTTYYNANISATQITAITNLADAKALMAKMSLVADAQAKMIIAMRDEIWPNLQDV